MPLIKVPQGWAKDIREDHGADLAIVLVYDDTTRTWLATVDGARGHVKTAKQIGSELIEYLNEYA